MIRLFAQQNDGASEDAAKLRLRVLQLLAHAIELNILEGRGLPADHIKDSLARLAHALEKDHPEPAVLQAAGVSSQALQQYFQRLSRLLDSLAADLTLGIRTFEEAMSAVDGEHANHLSRLESIGKSLAQPRGIDDVKLLQQQFEECLSAFRQSQARSSQHLRSAFEHLSQSSQNIPVPPPQFVFAVLHLHRLDPIRDRFGPSIPQALTRHLAHLISSRWPTADPPQPLAPGAILLLDSKNLNLEQHRHTLRRLVSERPVYTATHEDREYLLPISFDWIANFAASREQARSLAEAFLANPS